MIYSRIISQITSQFELHSFYAPKPPQPLYLGHFKFVRLDYCCATPVLTESTLTSSK